MAVEKKPWMSTTGRPSPSSRKASRAPSRAEKNCGGRSGGLIGGGDFGVARRVAEIYPEPQCGTRAPAARPPGDNNERERRDMERLDWNKAFEFTWRILVFIVAIGIIIVVSTNWTRWEGGAGWQRTNDAYLQADLTPISAKVAGYVRELPIQDYERVHKGQVLAQLDDVDYRAAVAQSEGLVATALAQVE